MYTWWHETGSTKLGFDCPHNPFGPTPFSSNNAFITDLYMCNSGYLCSSSAYYLSSSFVLPIDIPFGGDDPAYTSPNKFKNVIACKTNILR